MITDDERKLVLARIENMPSHMKLSIGGEGSLTKESLIQKIKSGDPLGNKYIEIELHYLQNPNTIGANFSNPLDNIRIQNLGLKYDCIYPEMNYWYSDGKGSFQGGGVIADNTNHANFSSENFGNGWKLRSSQRPVEGILPGDAPFHVYDCRVGTKSGENINYLYCTGPGVEIYQQKISENGAILPEEKINLETVIIDKSKKISENKSHITYQIVNPICQI